MNPVLKAGRKSTTQLRWVLAPHLVPSMCHLAGCLQEYDKAMTTYEEGLRHDPESAELKEGLMRCIEAINKVSLAYAP